MSPMGTPGSLGAFMDALQALEQTINSDLTGGLDPLHIYEWRPRTIDAPALYHWLSPSPAELRDIVRQRDTLNLQARIAVRHTDADVEMSALSSYADAFRDVVDQDLAHPAQSALRSVCAYADRTEMRTVLDTFNEIDFLCMQFTLEIRIDRTLH